MTTPTEDLPAGQAEPAGQADPAEPDELDRPPAAGPVTNLVAAGAVVILGGVTFAGSLRLGVGSPSAPGPGTWPTLASAVLVVLGLVLAARFRHTDDAGRFTRSGLLVVAAVATMVGFVAVIDTIGFEIPTAVLAFVWLRFLGRERWHTSIVISLAATAVFYLLFVAALDVSIPHLF